MDIKRKFQAQFGAPDRQEQSKHISIFPKYQHPTLEKEKCCNLVKAPKKMSGTSESVIRVNWELLLICSYWALRHIGL